MGRVVSWKEEELLVLREGLHESYDVLQERVPGRSIRAIQHKLHVLGLRRTERPMWTEQEIDVLKKNRVCSSRELVEQGLVGNHTLAAVSMKRRELFGSALRTMEFIESEDVAWLFGAIFSDGCVRDAQLSFTQKGSDVVFLQKVQSVLSGLGMPVKISNSGTEYVRLWSCSKEYKRLLGKESWNPMSFLEKVDERYAWVKKEPFVWHFLGGVLDGDGSVKRTDVGGSKEYVRVELAVKGVREQEWLALLMKSVGFEWGVSGVSMFLKGGMAQAEDFLSKVKTVIPRKKNIVRVLGEGVVALRFVDAKKVIEEYHYLGTLPVGVRCFGFVREGELLGVAAFGWAQRSKRLEGKRMLELKRFVLVRNEKNLASTFLGGVLRVLRADDVCDGVISYADKEFHTGTIYKAVGFEEVAETGESMAYVLPTGDVVGGRFALETIRARGFSPDEVKIRVVAGKKKFVKLFQKKI